MVAALLTALLSLSALASAGPLINDIVRLSKRNVCDGVNAIPVLYHEYREADCPARNHLTSGGLCPGYDDLKNKCQAYCQVRTNFVYATEKPFTNTYCHGPLTCTIQSNKQESITISGNFNLKFLEAYGVGVSGGYSSTQATAFSRSFQIKLNENECGYFTFVPVRKEVCGTMTGMNVASRVVPGGGGDVVQVCDGGFENIANFCGNQVRRNPDGSSDGDTIFVRTDCATREPLPNDRQDPIYQKPGVPLDRGTLKSILESWQDNSCDVSYKFLFDQFEIRGKVWEGNELGANGEGLLKQLRGCGDLTEWHFEWTPNDVTYEWYASGHLPIGTKNCVGNAVHTAGGPGADTGNCSGAG